MSDIDDIVDAMMYSWTWRHAGCPTREECMRKYDDVKGAFVYRAGKFALASEFNQRPLPSGRLLVDDPYGPGPADPDAARRWFESVLPLRERMNLSPDPQPGPDDAIPIAKAPTAERIADWLNKHVETLQLYHGGVRYSCRQCCHRLAVYKPGGPGEKPTDRDLFRIALQHHMERHSVSKPMIQDLESAKVERFAERDYVRWRIGTEAWADAEVESVSTVVAQQVCKLKICAVSPGWAAVWAVRAPRIGDSENVSAHCLKHISRPPSWLADGQPRVGEYGRLSWGDFDEDDRPWVEGEVLKIHRPKGLDLVAEIRIDRSNRFPAGQVAGIGIEHGVVFRRIPRPVDATPDLIARINADVRSHYTQTGHLPPFAYIVSRKEFEAISDRLTMKSGSRYAWHGVLQTDGRKVDVLGNVMMKPGDAAVRRYMCKCGTLYLDDSSRSGLCEACMLNQAQATAERLAREFTEFRPQPDDSPDPVCFHNGSCGPSSNGPCKAKPTKSLIDGLTLDECCDRWFRNRRRLESSVDWSVAGIGNPGRQVGQLEPMTPAQIAVAKANSDACTGPRWEMDLRKMVDESTAADRAREVSIVCDAWEDE